MGESSVPESDPENRHTGEVLTLRRVRHGDEVWLELKRFSPSASGRCRRCTFTFLEDEEGTVQSGTLSAVIDGRQLTVGRRRIHTDSPRCRASMVERRQ